MNDGTSPEKRPGRPELHYTPPGGWMNDPNGLLYHRGTYHLFYQYDPLHTTPVSMHWGHASSRDLLHWQEHTVALCPDENGVIYSGSLVFDAENVSDFGSKSAPALVAAYTCHLRTETGYRESQALAYSTDGGETFTKYAGNPVLRGAQPDFRDPKLIYIPRMQKWVMPVVAGQKVQFYASHDLKTWSYLSEFTAELRFPDCVWECPDLFPLRADDGTERWILLTSVIAGGACHGVQYAVGTFDGVHFLPDHPGPMRMLEFGFDNYAAVTFGGTVDRRLLIGWMGCWKYAVQTPCEGYRGSMTFPRELELHRTPEGGYRLGQKLAKELQAACPNRRVLEQVHSIPLEEGASYLELRLPRGNTELEFMAAGQSLRIAIDADRGTIAADRRGCGGEELGEWFHRIFAAPLKTEEPFIELKILLDRNSIELFADRGETACTLQHFAGPYFTELRSSGKISYAEVRRAGP